MATKNYTTKTAALRATSADVRKVQVSKKIEIGKSGTGTTVSEDKVETTSLWISPDGKQETEKQNVLDLLNTAVHVGADADGDYNVDEAKVKTNKINFLGAYVNVVDLGEEGVNVYIGENKNNPSYSSLNNISGEKYYVYESSTDAWELPSGATANSQYGITSALSGSETVKVQNGAAIGNILADQTVLVTVTSDKGTITYETGKISEFAGKTAATLSAESGTEVTADAPTSKTWDDTANTGIKVAGSSLIKYTSSDAKNGFTPNSSTGIFSVTVKNSAVVGTKGGWYNISVKIGGTTKTTSSVYVYAPQSETPSVGKPEITYEPGTTKYISGLAYDSSGSFTLVVDDISNTQQSMTTTLNRLALTDKSGDVSFATTVANNTTGMSLKSGSKSDETAVYTYTKTLSPTTSAAKKVSCGISAQAYGQSAVAGEKVASDVCTATTWLYTDNGDDEDLVTKFQKDGARKYGDLAAAKSASGATATYDSEKSLITDYTDQLLVQDGKLRYPNSDKTSRYSGATETRYYVRPVMFGGSDQVKTVKVTVSDMTSFDNNNTRMYLVKKGVSDAQVLNWFKTAACSYGVPVADADKPTSNSWTCTINNDVFQIFGGVADTFYLVVEMTKNSTEMGQITLA